MQVKLVSLYFMQFEVVCFKNMQKCIFILYESLILTYLYELISDVRDGKDKQLILESTTILNIIKIYVGSM